MQEGRVRTLRPNAARCSRRYTALAISKQSEHKRRDEKQRRPTAPLRGCPQPSNRGRINCIGASHVGLRLASRESLQGLLTLMGCQLPRPTKPHTPFLCPLTALSRPRADQVALELSQSTQDGQHQPTMRTRGVGPCILETFEAGALLGHRVDDVEQVPR